MMNAEMLLTWWDKAFEVCCRYLTYSVYSAWYVVGWMICRKYLVYFQRFSACKTLCMVAFTKNSWKSYFYCIIIQYVQLSTNIHFSHLIFAMCLLFINNENGYALFIPFKYKIILIFLKVDRLNPCVNVNNDLESCICIGNSQNVISGTNMEADQTPPRIIHLTLKSVIIHFHIWDLMVNGLLSCNSM